VIAIILFVLTSAILAQGFLEGGLHDYIFTMPRESLVNWALATEKYHRKALNINPRGGLHDYIGRLSDQEIVSYILKQTDEHPEIANKEKLDSLVTEFGISAGNNQEKGHRFGEDGGLHDYIWRMPREKLINWALTTEAYHRDVKHLHLVGGLHDYISTLENDQIIDYIMVEVKEHPELASSEKLDSLSVKYNIDANSVHNVPPSAPESKGIIGGDGGLHDYIWKLQRGKLNTWALATEKYHRKINNIRLYGGLHDYIDTLSNGDVIEYIMKEVKEHPEIATSHKLDSLVSEFGITEDDVHKAPQTQVETGLIGGDGGLHDYVWRLE